MPMTGLPTLEEPFALVAGDDTVEDCLLRSCVVQVVVDDVIAERSTRDRSRLERGYRFAERPGEPLGVRLVGVALERRRRLEALLDPVQPGRNQCGERQVRVDVTAGNPRLDAQRRPVADDAKSAGTVVVAPGERRRRPGPRREALVRVHVRRKEHCELRGTGDPPGEELLEDLRL